VMTTFLISAAGHVPGGHVAATVESHGRLVIWGFLAVAWLAAGWCGGE
jgi:hypothetical protein